jgi:AcrR family transcriptional regulator
MDDTDEPQRQHYLRRGDAWREVFLASLQRIPIVSWAAKRAGIDRASVYVHYRNDKAFREAMDNAREIGAEKAERELFRRGVEGVPKGIWHMGVRVGEERVYSDTLLLAIVKAYKKGLYAERHELTGADGEPLGAAVLDETAKAARVAALLKVAQDRMAAAKVSEDLC